MKQTVTVRSHLYFLLQLNLILVSNMHISIQSRVLVIVRVLGVIGTIPMMDFDICDVRHLLRNEIGVLTTDLQNPVDK